MTTDNDGTWEPIARKDIRTGDMIRTTWRWNWSHPDHADGGYERLTPPPRTFEPGELVTATVESYVTGGTATRTLSWTGTSWLDIRSGEFYAAGALTNIRRLVVLDEERQQYLNNLLRTRNGTFWDVIRAFVEQEEQR